MSGPSLSRMGLRVYLGKCQLTDLVLLQIQLSCLGILCLLMGPAASSPITLWRVHELASSTDLSGMEDAGSGQATEP